MPAAIRMTNSPSPCGRGPGGGSQPERRPPVPLTPARKGRGDLALLSLLTWLSPAFPTGGFAYSHGLEWAVEAGDVANEASAHTWIAAVLAYGSGWNDAILLRHAYRGDDVADLALALATSCERRTETQAQGHAFAAAGTPWGKIAPAPYPVSVGRLAAMHGIDADAAAIAYLHAFAANLISAAVRLVPLGQQAGLRILAALEPIILDVAARSRDATLDDLGGVCFRSDIAAMRHETQRTRLFRT
jgi:urease accessory protein